MIKYKKKLIEWFPWNFERLNKKKKSKKKKKSINA
jgi:hypothetical protein